MIGLCVFGIAVHDVCRMLEYFVTTEICRLVNYFVSRWWLDVNISLSLGVGTSDCTVNATSCCSLMHCRYIYVELF